MTTRTQCRYLLVINMQRQHIMPNAASNHLLGVDARPCLEFMANVARHAQLQTAPLDVLRREIDFQLGSHTRTEAILLIGDDDTTNGEELAAEVARIYSLPASFATFNDLLGS